MPIDLNTIKRNEVENLNLMGTPFIQDDIAKLAAALASNTSIKKLDLSFCNLEDSEFELIAKAILKHPKLELLDIGDNQLTNKSIQLLEELAKLTNISEIKARYNQFDVD
ncbi:MAG TPA: hypothetical protein VHA13_02265, partial [Gammaproteobacteria bacterium]|nr:hypothetical protein [Gammaproteobacteria bacterium]